MGGFSVIQLRDNKYIDYHYAEYTAKTTNNREELKALLHVLKYISRKKFSNQDIIIYCDSAYTINVCTKWMDDWQFKGWRKANGEIIENLDIIENLYEYYTKILETCQLKLLKCKGHYGILGNELVDALASANSRKWHNLIVENELEFS